MIPGPDEVVVKATVNLAGLRAGQEAFADPHNPDVAELLAHGWLVRVEGDPEEATGADSAATDDAPVEE